MVHRLRYCSLLCVFAAFAFSPLSAFAQIKPFKIQGGGVAESIPLMTGHTGNHWSVGNATHLGNHQGQGALVLGEPIDATRYYFSSDRPFVFTAANGDQLAFNYGLNGGQKTGEVQLYFITNTTAYAVFVADFTPVPSLCTGRFKNVIGGSFEMTAETEPFSLLNPTNVGYQWKGQGTLEFGKKEKK